MILSEVKYITISIRVCQVLYKKIDFRKKIIK